ncbi:MULTISPECIES: maleylpyruvate isomerase family mycothiol-dependent enzyme [unclassified Crossiella]|uniref:maleylpyruvate isomerase family mycothiol-dependent enzyme n=1 Tax=unclassified Crossiella TaxID=2620835 RepID=UPI002000532C|nr:MULTISPECIES: maleylpyruvate isomerase family mycothiol-dependent enzyme [unclassified Crossiella]MCK2244632.1 maleylpyruvate isomerase family mycothiol-dependent enzyme [Crossiella sp. S99.2]MCK2258381.1 maleylpyruvate isomerase family mycothiol-dependent enzyme [Crossiella sp. S99.1]
MSATTDQAQWQAWMDEGYVYLAQWLNMLSDKQLDEPSGLAGWTRRHVLAHVGFNARALGRLVHWAASGEATPMYADESARAAEIAHGALLPVPELRELVRTEQFRLNVALHLLEPAEWEVTVVTAQGRAVPAGTIPWLRAREVWVHAVDLQAGADFPDFPADLLDALIIDVVQTRRRREQSPALVLAPLDRDEEWIIEAPGTPIRVLGRAADLARWLTGRGVREVRSATGEPLPDLGPWL